MRFIGINVSVSRYHQVVSGTGAYHELYNRNVKYRKIKRVNKFDSSKYWLTGAKYLFVLDSVWRVS